MWPWNQDEQKGGSWDMLRYAEIIWDNLQTLPWKLLTRIIVDVDSGWGSKTRTGVLHERDDLADSSRRLLIESNGNIAAVTGSGTIRNQDGTKMEPISQHLPASPSISQHLPASPSPPAGEISAAPNQSSSQPPSATAWPKNIPNTPISSEANDLIYLMCLNGPAIAVDCCPYSLKSLVMRMPFLDPPNQQIHAVSMPGASRRLQDFCQVFIIGRVGMVWCWIFREVRHSLQVQVVQVKLAKPHISKYIKELGGPPIQMVRSPYQHSILGPQLWETHLQHVQHVQHKMAQNMMNMAIMAELIRKPKQNILRTSGNPPRRVCSTRCRNFAIWSLVLEATWNPQIQPGNDQEMMWTEVAIQKTNGDSLGLRTYLSYLNTCFFVFIFFSWHRIHYLMTTWWLLDDYLMITWSAWIVRAWEGRCPGRISIGRIWVGLTAEGPGIAVASELLHFQLRNQRLMSTGVDRCRPVSTGNIYPCTIGAIHLCIIQISFNYYNYSIYACLIGYRSLLTLHPHWQWDSKVEVT